MTAGLITIASAYHFAETLERLIQAVGQGGAEVFAKVDHAENARAAGMSLRPTTLVVFGAGKAGTPLMAAQQSLGLDLPLRALVFQDEAGKVQVAYNTPAWIVERQGLDPAAFPQVAGMARFLEAAVAHATAG